MIDWEVVSLEDCDMQVDIPGKCLVVSLPFIMEEDHHVNPVVRHILKEAVAEKLAAGEIHAEGLRCRFSEEGEFNVLPPPADPYPTGQMGSTAFHTYKANPDADEESSESSCSEEDNDEAK